MSEETAHRSTRRRSRTAIASYLRRVADAFEGDEPVPVEEDGSVTVDPPEESELEVQVERDDDETSLELAVVWHGDEGALDTDPGPASNATFELYTDKADEWRWRLRHDNGNIVADSGEGYTKKANAVNGIDSVRTNAPGAPIEELD